MTCAVRYSLCLLPSPAAISPKNSGLNLRHRYTERAAAAYNAARDTGIPVVYTAISDPAEPDSSQKTEKCGNITGFPLGLSFR